MSQTVRIEMKPFRQTWLSLDVMHSAPSAYLCMINNKQYAQLEHPFGGSLTCIQNRTGMLAQGVEKIEGKWYWVFENNDKGDN